MTGTHTPGPWQPGRPCDTVVATMPAGHGTHEETVRHYGGHLVAESIAARNVPIIAAAPTLMRRLERTTQTMLAAADALQKLVPVCRVNHLYETAGALLSAVDHLRSTARLNASVIERARGTKPNEDSET